MNRKTTNHNSTGHTRRQILAECAGLGIVGLAGCLDSIGDRAGQSAAENAISNKHAFPAAFFGGDSRPDGTLIESDYTQDGIEIVVSGEYRGIEASVKLYGHYINSLMKAENHNGSRTSRIEEISSDKHARRAETLYDYLGGNPTVCERFVVTFPDARLGDDDRALSRHVTPPRLLRSTTGETIGRAPQADAGNVFQWESAVPQLSTEIKHPWPPLGTTGPFNPNEQLIAAGGGDGDTDPTVVNIGPLLDVDRNSNGHNGVSVANGRVSGFSWDDVESWGEETPVGEALVSPMVLASVSAQPEDCPEPIPALLFVQRIRHNGQCIYAGGWTINDNALYQDAVTMLVADAEPTVVPVRLDQSEDSDNPDSIRQTIIKGLDDDRSLLGSVLYTDRLGEDRGIDEATLRFLPTGHREGPGRRRLIRSIWESAGHGDGQESVNGTIVSLDAPIVHSDYPFQAGECLYYPYPPHCWKTNLVPAVNTISSR